MSQADEQQKIRQLLASMTNKRARIVLEHILEHGFVTTEQLEKQYGYNHPPRAARDVRELGIPLETFRVKDSTGRSIAAYRLGDLDGIQQGRLAGRRTFPKRFRDELYAQNGGKCSICYGSFAPRYLQIDHRVPYEVVGDRQEGLNPQEFMLVCAACNRAKSWSCEHCTNWQQEKSAQVCGQCYWATPESYVHVALRQIRRTDILWDEEGEVALYDKVAALAGQNERSIPEQVKKVVAMQFGQGTPSAEKSMNDEG
jgi:hypothetical protein